MSFISFSFSFTAIFFSFFSYSFFLPFFSLVITLLFGFDVFFFILSIIDKRNKTRLFPYNQHRYTFSNVCGVVLSLAASFFRWWRRFSFGGVVFLWRRCFSFDGDVFILAATFFLWRRRFSFGSVVFPLATTFFL